MRLFLISLVCSVGICYAANTYAQSTEFTINAKNQTVENILTQIEAKSDFGFFFNNKHIDLNRLVSFSVQNKTVYEILNTLFEGTDITYTILDKKIILAKKGVIDGSPNSTLSNQGINQNKTIKGKVVDSKGEPVIGANVLEKGTMNGTITDIDGNYTLSVNSNAILVISYIGYKPVEVVVNGKSSLIITLTEDTEALDEVVVIGYGTAKRKDFTGSVSSVKIENSPIALTNNTNALEGLKGKITGLDVGYSNSAGSTPSLLIRGQNSISGTNDPLIIVDGIIYMGSINDINPNDIASIDVLKDATSAAAYGSRSANGVIIITTKKGKIGKPIVHFNVKSSMETWHLKPKLMNGGQWLDAVATANGYSDYSFVVPQEQFNINSGKEINWLNEISRTGWLQDYQVAVSGAGERMNYYLSTSYTNNEGVIKGDNYNRISAMVKINTDITNWLEIGMDAGFSRSDYSGISASLTTAAIISPYGMKYRPNGELEVTPDGTRGHGNPLWNIDDKSKVENPDKSDNLRTNTFLFIKCPWISGLNYHLNFASNITSRDAGYFVHEKNFVPNGSYDDDERYSVNIQNSYLSSAYGYITYERTTSYVIDNILNYVHTVGKHNIDLTAVATRDSKHYKYKYLSGSDFAANGNTTLGINGLHYATTQKFSLSNWKQNNIGYFGRVSYSYNDTYYLTGSFRRDGASVFGSEDKWGNFGAIGAAWRITNEPFIKKLTLLNNMKLKLSWGRNGNQGLSTYSTLSRVVNGQGGGIYYVFGNSSKPSYGINQTSLGNTSLGWEKTEAWNMGFESSWLDNRLFVDLDVYFSKTSDQIFYRTIPVMTGFSSMYSSMGEVRNKGFEATIRSINVKNNDFQWTTELTAWLNRNKLQHLYGEDLDEDGKEDNDIGNGLFIGESIHSIFGYKQDGIVQTNDTEYMNANGVKAGTPKYVDQNGDGVINADDRVILGSTDPNFKLNLTSILQYKNWELYFILAGVFGGNGYFQKANEHAYITCGDRGQFASNGLYIPYWTESSPSNKYPAATFTGDGYFLGLQSREYIRLQDVTLSYTFNQPWIKTARIQNMKLFITGKNLFTITGWNGGDPESGSTIMSGTLPIMSSISVGLNLSF